MSGDVDDRDEPSIKARPDADQIWLQQVRDGDDDAWQMLIDQFEGRLLAFATARVNDRVTAEDIVQEVLISLWTRKSDLEVQSLEAYLGTAVRFSVFKALARDRKRRELLA